MPVFAEWSERLGMLFRPGRSNPVRFIRCCEDDIRKQPDCDGYMPHPDWVERECPHAQYCWFNYDGEGEPTDKCFRPGILK
jgi:hypothetical protein